VIEKILHSYSDQSMTALGTVPQLLSSPQSNFIEQLLTK
jgi:hypothetical protein